MKRIFIFNPFTTIIDIISLKWYGSDRSIVLLSTIGTLLWWFHLKPSLTTAQLALQDSLGGTISILPGEFSD